MPVKPLTPEEVLLRCLRRDRNSVQHLCVLTKKALGQRSGRTEGFKEIAEGARSMPRNRVQHQKGLSDDAFERLYPDEEACRRAWFAWRWPEDFKCPRCAAAEYCEIRDRQLLQCRCCRYQSSLIAGTVLQGTKLPMRVWFRAMHLLAQGKKGLSNIELGRRLGVSTNAAWRVQHKLMQAMIERDRRYQLGVAGPRIEIDDAYIGGERTGEGAGRGRRGHTPFIIAVETSAVSEALPPPCAG